MEEFLNSENFKQMAREYQKKYNSISVLKSVCIDKKHIISLITNLHRLVFIIDKGFAKNAKLNEIFKKCNLLNNKIKDLESYFDINIQQNDVKQGLKFNYKCLYNLILEIFGELFFIEKTEKIEIIEETFELFYDLINLIFSMI